MGYAPDLNETNADWEKRTNDLWAAIDDYDETEFIAQMDRLERRNNEIAASTSLQDSASKARFRC